MPKLVDAEERRRLIVDAVFRLVASGGFEAASLRNVAAEAGLNVGSVRHYFASHDALMLAATEEMAARVEARMTGRGAELDRAFVAGNEAAMESALVALYAELLPLDEERTRECSVWLAFTERARVSPDLGQAGEAMHRQVVTATLRILEASGLPDAATRAALLTVGVDGLTLAALAWPAQYPPARQRHLLALLLRQAFGPAPVE